MGKKYIIEKEQDEHVYKTIINACGDPVIREIIYTPYTEPDTESIRKEAYEKGLSDGKNQDAKDFADMYDSGYGEGLKDAWEAARKIANIPYGEEEKVFGSDGWTFITNHTAQEAIEEIRQYEQEKDRHARIEYNFDEIKDVIETTAKEYNMSLDEIAEVLKKMGEH